MPTTLMIFNFTIAIVAIIATLPGRSCFCVLLTSAQKAVGLHTSVYPPTLLYRNTVLNERSTMFSAKIR